MARWYQAEFWLPVTASCMTNMSESKPTKCAARSKMRPPPPLHSHPRASLGSTQLPPEHTGVVTVAPSSSRLLVCTISQSFTDIHDTSPRLASSTVASASRSFWYRSQLAPIRSVMGSRSDVSTGPEMERHDVHDVPPLLQQF